MDIQDELLSSQQVDSIIEDVLKAQGITSDEYSGGEVSLLPTEIYALALKKYVPLVECSDIHIQEDANGRRRVTGTYTFTDEDGKVKTYKVSQFIKSLPVPEGEIKKRKRAPKKAKKSEEVAAAEEEDEEARVKRLFSEVASLKKLLNKRQKKRRKAEEAAAAAEPSAN